ncbi:MAG: hypothetical protein ABJF07_23835, partial [Nisaea sp.]|uniref:hypothetical protein n=1 Tax=Nisaea sp. TaxID=2024842 RepID=UPI003267A60D
VTVCLGINILLGGLFAVYVDRSGRMDPDVLRLAPDDRKLTNVREFSSPLVDAAILGNGAKAVLARADGVVHVVDINKELFREEALPISEFFSGQTKTVSSSCPSGTEDCSVDAATMLTTNLGGVALREADGAWRVLLGDQAWIGSSSNPVEQSNVTQWAVSDDGDTLLVLAGSEGSAFFDQTSARWRPIDTNPSLGQRGFQEKFAVHALGRFWAATDQGLFSISEDDAQPTFSPHSNLTGDILDLDLSHDGRLRVLERGMCRQGAVVGCLTLSEVTGPEGSRRIIGEGALYPQLAAASVNHAALQSGRLVVLGQAGAYAYNPTVRSWTQLHPTAIDTLHAVDDGERIIFASGENVGEITSGAVSNLWTIENAPARQVVAARDGSVFALARGGNLYDVGRGRQLTFKDARVPENADFTTGATVGSLTVLTGPQGVWVHDVERRRNTWLPADQVPPELTRPGSMKLFAFANAFILVRQPEAQAFSIMVSGGANAATISSTPVDINVARGPFLQAALGTDGLRIVDARGQPFVYADGGVPRLIPLVGAGANRPDTSPRFISAASHSGGLLFADADAIWPYSTDTRVWQRPIPPPTGETIRDISVGDKLFVLTNSRRVYRASGSGWGGVLGDGIPLPLSRRDVSDAVIEGGLLFLGGSGRVVAYDIQRGIVVETWEGGSGSVRLLRIEGRVPVWVSGGQLLRGSRALVSEGLVNAWEAPDGITALMRNARNGRLFLQNFSGTSARFACVFAGDVAPRGDVIATRRIDADRVLVATNQGAAIHNARHRRWLTVTGLPKDPDLRLDIVDGFLVAHRPSQFLSLLIAKFPRPTSCATAPVAIPWEENYGDFAVEFDPASGAALLLARDGRVWEWRAGTTRRLFDTPTVGPDPSQLLRLRQLSNGDPLFVGRAAVWRYSIATRRWSSTPVNAPEGATVSITAIVSDVATLSVWDGPTRTLTGTWRPDAQQVTLTEFKQIRAPRINTPPGNIVDVAERDGLVAVVSRSGVEIGGRESTTLDGRVQFSGENPDLQLYDYGRHPALVSGPLERPDTIWLLPAPWTMAGTQSTLSELAYIYRPATDRDFAISSANDIVWRINADGELLRCNVAPGARSPDTCETVTSAPFAYETDDLVDAYRIGDTWALFFADRTLRISATTWRDEEIVDGFVLRSGDEVIREERHLYIRRDATREVFRLGDQGAAVRLGSNVYAMQRAINGFAIGTPERVRLLPTGPSGVIEEIG